MKKSEKILALCVGVVLLLGIIFYGAIDFVDQYEMNKKRIKGLNSQIQDEHNKMAFAIAASDRQGLFYEKISFPTDKNQITAYQDWLENNVRGSGLRINTIGDPKQKILKVPGKRGAAALVIGKKYEFHVVTEGTLNEIIDFCYRFDTIDVLQKIKDIILLPLNKKKSTSGQVKASFKIELLALKNADEVRDFQQAKRKPPVAIDEYERWIVGRNIFGPANSAPSIRVSNKTVEEGEDISVSLSGSDEDQDELTFEIMDAGGFKDAKIKSSSNTRAKFVASAMPIGEYVAVVKVTDNGFPQKSSEKEFKVVVEKKEEEPPEVIEEPVEELPAVLESPSTQITSVTSRNSEFTVKIRNRMSGQRYVLKIDGEFELDEKTWTVKEIDSYKVIIQVDGEQRAYRNGDFLDKPRTTTPIGNEPESTETDKDTKDVVETTTS